MLSRQWEMGAITINARHCVRANGLGELHGVNEDTLRGDRFPGNGGAFTFFLPCSSDGFRCFPDVA